MAGEGFVAAGEEILAGIRRGLDRSAEEIMVESLILVPKLSGTLMRSSRILPVVEDLTQMSITFGYGFGSEVSPERGLVAGAYAAPVHEIAEHHHAAPTQYKFLEDPVYAYAAVFGDTLEGAVHSTLSIFEPGNVVDETGARLPAGLSPTAP